ncbi:MAG: substrate-binding domain-containing protein [Marmoricola sp.]
MRNNTSGLGRIGVALVAAAVLTIGATGIATADPNYNPDTGVGTVGDVPAGKTLPSQVIAGVGADAFAELTNNFANAYNNRAGATDPVLASYDAVNPKTSAAGDTITPKPGCSLVRPNGANGGLSEILKNNKSTVDTNAYCVDFVRASRAKKTDNSENALTFFAQSRDAVGYATIGNAYAPTKPLTQDQLRKIYTCQITDWSEVGGQAGDIHLCVQPSSAATYTFWLQALGLTNGVVDVAGGCGAVGAAGSRQIMSQQNDGRTLQGDPQGIAPYTISKWAAQENEVPGIRDLRGGADLGLIVTAAADVAVAPVITQGQYQVLNPAFSAANPAFSRYFFNAVRTADPNFAGLSAIFGPGGYLCTNQDALLVPYGNTPLGASCGSENP